MSLKYDLESAKGIKDTIVKWIQDWFEANGKDCNAVIGISGGKDSTVCAALLVEALGKDRVIGVEMPDVNQADIDDADKVIDFLGIKSYRVNIGFASTALKNEVLDSISVLTPQAKINLAPRLRMATLYLIAQSSNGRVCNTCNYSEDYVGYSTLWGDSAGDFAPIQNLLVHDVKAVGYALGLPKELIEKIPSDGLCGKSDEDNLGFTYEELDTYLYSLVPHTEPRKTIDTDIIKIIKKKQQATKFKLKDINLDSPGIMPGMCIEVE